MPSGSRKRNKGKDRKAKQQAKKLDNGMRMMYSLWCGSMHRCGAIIQPDFDHPVSKLLNEYYLRLATAVGDRRSLLREAFETHPQVFHNESNRKMLLDILIRVCTSMLVVEPTRDTDEHVNTALNMTSTILVLEEYDKTNDFNSALDGRATSSKRRHLSDEISSYKRDVLKFYRKRLSCKCLKRMHLDSRKSTPKMARCFNCNVEKERASLSVCSRCMVTEYCSRECQVANWDKHMRDCEECIRADVWW